MLAGVCLRAAPAPAAAPFRPCMPTRSLAAGRTATRRLQVSCGIQDPWSTLGVSRGASEQEVKRAHRQLVKQHHPDVKQKKGDALAHAQFLRIQEAYELIMGKRAGKEVEGRPADKSGWSFHDWYWSFSMKRRKGPFAAAAAAGEPPLDAFRQQWQAQMAGLKQKAAAKRWKQGRRRPAHAAAAEAAAQGAPAAGPASSPAAREQVWRSMTKNARNADKARAQQAAAAQELAAAQRSAPAAAVGAGPAPQQAAPQQPPSQAAAQAAQPAAPQHHAAQPAAAEHAGSGGSSSHMERLQRLMQQAASVVQGRHRQQGAGAAAPEHTAQQAAVRARMTLQQLSSLLGGGGQARHHQQQGAAESNAVPADQHLHQRFQDDLRRRQEAAAEPPTHHATAAASLEQEAAEGAEVAAASEQSQEPHQPPPRGYGSHARKFANRDEVEQRLSSQLAGLKRRAALKHEVNTTA